tara:strand:+ start:2781 stop:3431 length:651 start_codon:yes stop_codon:yes gene_type:complete
MISSNIKVRVFTSLVLFFLLSLVIFFDFMMVYSLIVLGTLSLIEFFNLTKKILINSFTKIICNLFFITYVSIFCLFFVYFFNFIELKLILFTLLLGCIASDVGGFVVGKTFKGPKLTKISPNKTISGSFGSTVFSVFVIFLLFYYFTNSLNYKIIIVGIVTSIACQIGDLFFSLCKRKAKVKDTGNFFPGHGGVLDRLDGIFFGLPLGFLSLILIY